MGSLIIAKQKIKSLTSKLEKSLYKLKYSELPINGMTDELYDKIKYICKSSNLHFPLVRYYDDIFINCDTPKVFHTLSKLADEHGIILDIEKTIE